MDITIDQRREIYKEVEDIIQGSLEEIESDDPDYWCEDCSYAYQEEDHSSPCDCSCHDALGFYEACANKLTNYIVTTLKKIS